MLRFDRQVEQFQDDDGNVYDLHELGRDGWELVSISGWAFGKALVFFKRVQWNWLPTLCVESSMGMDE